MSQTAADTQRYPVPDRCPVCSHELTVTRLQCDTCGTGIDGHFAFNRFARLSGDQLRFLEAFVKNRGIIKDVEAELGISYPTVRARLDDLLGTLGLAPASPDQMRPSESRDARREILHALQNKEISASEASRRLAALTTSGS
jgi:hypothetical protein